jgi:hypothetical protein
LEARFFCGGKLGKPIIDDECRYKFNLEERDLKAFSRSVYRVDENII